MKEKIVKWFNSFKAKLRNSGYLAGAAVYLLETCGMKIDEPVVYGIVNAAAGLLIVLGIVGNPEKGKKV